MPIGELLPYLSGTVGTITSAYLLYRWRIKKLDFFRHVVGKVDRLDPAAAVAIINATKLDTPWKPRPEPGSVTPRDEKAPPQLPDPAPAGRDDLSDRRGGAGGDRADPDEPGEGQPGAA